MVLWDEGWFPALMQVTEYNTTWINIQTDIVVSTISVKMTQIVHYLYHLELLSDNSYKGILVY